MNGQEINRRASATSRCTDENREPPVFWDGPGVGGMSHMKQLTLLGETKSKASPESQIHGRKNIPPGRTSGMPEDVPGLFLREKPAPGANFILPSPAAILHSQLHLRSCTLSSRMDHPGHRWGGEQRKEPERPQRCATGIQVSPAQE